MSPRLPAVVLSCLAALVLAGCGGGTEGPQAGDATLLLDFQPNAVHAGIYVAEARGFPQGEGVDLTVRTPGEGTDGIALLAANRVDFAIVDIHDLALARQRGIDIEGVMAVVQRPLAAVLAQPGVRTPRDLEGRRVGVTGLASDDAVLDTVVRGAGGDPKRVRRTQVGFDAVRNLVTRRVQGATAFWNAEGVQWQAERPGAKVFRVDDYGAPAYPELVLAARTSLVQDDPALVQAVVTSLRRGYRAAVLAPEEAVTSLTDAVDGLDRAQVQAQLDAVSPAFQNNAGAFGAFDEAALARWATWEQRVGIVRTKPNVTLMFAPQFARGTISDGG